MIDLKFDGVSKRYRIRQEAGTDTEPHSLLYKLKTLRRRAQDFWAVRDVSFEVKRGEALGIIGHNGAGKSTILKLLSNITAPTSGEITINGRLAALIEVGSGFHPDLTGRENVYLSGSILGMRRREIAAKLDSIVDFAGISQFIDTPVKRYSSGMYVRLGFSIAAHLDPDILLLDEVLAVGDAAFQAKCIDRIKELEQAGTTIVFISHDLGAVERLCNRVILMEHGEIACEGSPQEVIAKYKRAISGFEQLPQRSAQTASTFKKAEIVSVGFYTPRGREASTFYTGEPLIARIKYTVHTPVPDALFEIFFHSKDTQSHCQFRTDLKGERIDLEPGTGEIEFFCDELGLQPGSYTVEAKVKQCVRMEDIDCHPNCAVLQVEARKAVLGKFYMPHTWRFVSEDNINSDMNMELTLSEGLLRV